MNFRQKESYFYLNYLFLKTEYGNLKINKFNESGLCLKNLRTLIILGKKHLQG